MEKVFVSNKITKHTKITSNPKVKVKASLLTFIVLTLHGLLKYVFKQDPLNRILFKHSLTGI